MRLNRSETAGKLAGQHLSILLRNQQKLFDYAEHILVKNFITHLSDFRNNPLAFCLLCCFLLIALTLQAAAQESIPPDLILSGSGVKINYSPDAVFQTTPEEEPLAPLADDILNLRTLKIIFAETSTVGTCRLTDASLSAIKRIYPFIPDKQYQQLAAMKDQDYRQDDPVWGKAEALLAQLELYRSGLIMQYQVQPSLAEEMKKAELPQFIIESIQELDGTRYFNANMLTDGFQEKVKEKILSYKNSIMETANFLNMVYFLSSNSMLILKGKGIPSDLVDKLAILEGKYYITRHKLANEVQKILQRFAIDPGQALVKKAVDLAKKNNHLFVIKPTALGQILIDQLPEVVRAVSWENRKGYSFEKLVEMTTANSVLLRSYFRQNQQRILSEADVLENVHYQPEEPDGERMRRRGVAKWVAEAVEALYGEKYSAKEDYVLAIKAYKPKPRSEWKFPVLVVPQFRPAETPPVLDLSMLPQPMPLPDVLRWNEPKNYQLKQIDLTTKNCGCVAVPENAVYGLYPYWAAEGKPSQVDFSALSRIGYFYLQVDSSNQIMEQRHWQKQYSAFINQARQHKTKVDLVVYKQDWSCLSSRDFCPAGKRAEELTERIVSQLAPELDNNLLNRLKPIFSLGNYPMPTMGDGIMLYLTELPNNYSCFLSFVKMLRERLLGLPFGTLGTELAKPQQMSADKRLSLLIPDDFFLTQDTKAFARFKTFLAQAAAEPSHYFDGIVVVLRDNPAKRAKDIRLFIEQQFPEQQAVLNRKLIPLLTTSCGKQLDIGELKQIVRYAKSNFVGIGLFPVPVIEEKQSDGTTKQDEANAQAVCGSSDMYRLVKEEFQADELTNRPDAVGRVMKQYAPCLCKWACPNRWWIRIALDSLLLFFAVYAMLAFYFSALEEFFRNYRFIFWILAVLTGILIYLTFSCDPNYIDRTTDFLIFLLAMLVLTIRWSVRNRDYP